MKIVVQNFKTGMLSIGNVPEPAARQGSVLVRTHASLISPGTDRAIIGMARKTYLGKALDRPDLAKQVISKARTDGLWATYKVVKNLISEPIPLGYSAVGEVAAVGAGVTEFAVGQRVACAGLGHANHAEMLSVPKNLTVRVPEGVADEEAAYVTLGAIAMHGLRQAEQQLGAVVLVVGLGLLGQITVQLCRAAGYRVIGTDFDPRKLDLALKCGAETALKPDDPNLAASVARCSSGFGVDAVLLTAASRDSGAVFEQVAALCRDRARVVVVGDVKMEISRRTYFEKELEIRQSRSYGPGRYDPNYEEKGHDYPVGYVRWTEQRNMASFLDLIAARRIDMKALTTHTFPIGLADTAYDLVTGKPSDMVIGVLLTYDEPASRAEPAAPAVERRRIEGKVGLGVIGTGQFGKAVLLPALMGTRGFSMVGVASAGGISAESVRSRYDAGFATTDALKVLDSPEVQAVVVATRHDSHGRYVIEALRRDKHVFVEKPLCLTSEELAEIEETAARSAGTVTVGFNRRFSPLIVKMRDHFRGRQEPMALCYRVNAGRIPLNGKQSWVHDPSAGGGRIMGEVCHFVDAMQAVAQARPVFVSAFAVDLKRSDLANDDVVSVVIRFDDGSLGTIHYWANGDKSYPKERFEVFCQERVAVLDNFRSLELVAGGSSRKTRVLNMEKGFDEEAAAFLEACRTGIPPIPLQSLMDTTRVTIVASADLRA